jgi:hypothetical protein
VDFLKILLIGACSKTVRKQSCLGKGGGEAKGGETGSAGEQREQLFGRFHVVIISDSRKSGNRPNLFFHASLARDANGANSPNG